MAWPAIAPARALAVFSLLLLLAASLGPAPSAQAADWRQFRGPNGDGSSGDAAINMDWAAKPPATLWTFPLSDGGWSNPCVGDGRVFQIDHVETPAGTDAQGQPAPAKSEDVVRALDLATGKEIWHTAYAGGKKDDNGSFTGACPVLDGGKVYTTSRYLLVNCLDAKTGAVLWTRDARKDFAAKPAEDKWMFNAAPFIDENRLVIVPGGPEAAVVALDKNTGETLWQSPGGLAGDPPPIILGAGDAKQYVVFNAEGLIGLDPKDGKRLWLQPWKTDYNQNAASPIAIGKRILISSAHGVGTGLIDVTDNQPTVVWQNKEVQSRFPSPVLVKDFVYVTSEPEAPGFLVCLDPATGKIQWKQGGFEWGQETAVAGAVIAMDGKSGDMVLVAADPAAYRELGRIRPMEKGTAWNFPIVTDGKMLVRNKKMLYCLDVAP
jgi:outer membrane protein assembly factor BamB